MYSWVKWLPLSAVFSVAAVSADNYRDAMNDLGRNATPNEIAAWDIDVRPDFLGLPAGAGNVEDGEALWLEKCSVCHGDFGDSNEVFAPLVLGNVTPEDMEIGRVAALQDPAVVRTTLMKVNSISTVWDYINRAMPWNAPKSLSADEVYALVAYLLHLGYIVDYDFELSNENIAEIQAILPNRNGMTTDHGLWSVNGKPDVVGTDCTRNCDVDTTITSFLPDYAMNAHGNLKDQMRDYSPYPGMQTAPVDDSSAEEEAPQKAGPPLELLASNGCTGCHKVVGKLVGPGYDEVAAKYAGQPDAVEYLMAKIRNGGGGVWGGMPMPPMPQVSDADARTIAQWLSGGQ
jgi:cytochrome c